MNVDCAFDQNGRKKIFKQAAYYREKYIKRVKIGIILPMPIYAYGYKTPAIKLQKRICEKDRVQMKKAAKNNFHVHVDAKGQT